MVAPRPEQEVVSRVPAKAFRALVVVVSHPQDRLLGWVKAVAARHLPNGALRAAAHPRVVAALRHLARVWALVVAAATHPAKAAAVVAAMIRATRRSALS